MNLAICMSKIFDGSDNDFMLQGPMGTWAEVIDKDMEIYEKLYHEMDGKYKDSYPKELS